MLWQSEMAMIAGGVLAVHFSLSVEAEHAFRDCNPLGYSLSPSKAHKKWTGGGGAHDSDHLKGI